MAIDKQNILISACLLGKPVRYNGMGLLIEHQLLKLWLQEKRLFPICPEVSGGMSTPRAPAEIISLEPIKVMDIKKRDVTKAFLNGAQTTLAFAQENNCQIAIMTENSPSCGSSVVYDGSFTSIKTKGVGITSALLQRNGIHVFNQYQLREAHLFLVELKERLIKSHLEFQSKI